MKETKYEVKVTVEGTPSRESLRDVAAYLRDMKERRTPANDSA